MPKVAILESPEAVARAAAAWLAEQMKDAILVRGSASVALAGGKTPAQAYQALGADATVPWTHVRLYFSDERLVPPDHEDSNYRMASEALMRAGHVPKTAFARVHGETRHRESA